MNDFASEHVIDLSQVDYAAIEYRTLRNLYGALGPRAPKRKRRKRLAKKIAQRGGMLKTCGVVQSYFDAWPAVRMYHTPRREVSRAYTCTVEDNEIKNRRWL